MKKNGFISSALLYGMLALFLVIIISTLAILGNRKLGMDKIKSDALNTVRFEYAQMGSIYAIYDGFQSPHNRIWKDQSGNGHDATLYNFAANSYDNRHLVFDGTQSYIDTSINQNDLGSQITIQMVLNLKDLDSSAGSIGLFGWHDESLKQGIYAEVGNIYGDVTNTQAINFCTYIKNSEEPECVNVGKEFFENYLNKIIQITMVINNGEIKNGDIVVLKKGIDVYINGIHYDRIDMDEDFEINPSDTTLMIGRSSADNTKFMNGDLYNFVVYKTALTYNEVVKSFAADKSKYNIID